MGEGGVLFIHLCGAQGASEPGGSCRGWRSLRVICPKFTFPERSAAAGEWIWGFLSPPEQSVYKSKGNQATGETVLNDLKTSTGVFLG